jgi:hypothetical protein
MDSKMDSKRAVESGPFVRAEETEEAASLAARGNGRCCHHPQRISNSNGAASSHTKLPSA